MTAISLALPAAIALDGGMHDRDRYKLLFGPYRPPRCRVGGWLKCAVRGKVRVVGISDAPVMWPQCKAGKHLVPIVCGSLVRAVKRESVIAVAYHWGISAQTAVLWRKALGVAHRQNEGTHQLRVRSSPEVLTNYVREK